MQGIPHKRSTELRKLSRSKRTVARAYGGSKCHECVRNRYVFLINY
ncbi:hypothetical protein COB52_04765 [Candidatus Kaiserbacteria bacterium]|nr:MAG: hypothetical protein COB52_04765 [Candidatus Kaiserbacteria bacterium]